MAVIKGTRVLLTRTAIESMPKPDPDNPKAVVRLWDTRIPELHVVATRRSRSFALTYRTDGRERRMILGRCDRLTVDEARREAKARLGEVEKGIDPLAAKAEARQSVTLHTFWKEHYAPDAAVRLKASTHTEFTRLWTGKVQSSLGAKNINAVTRSDIAALHRKMKDTPYLANRTLALIKTVFTKAIEWGFRAEGANPASGVRPYPEQARIRLMSPDEVQRLWQGIEEEQRLGGRRSVEREGEAVPGKRGGEGLKEKESRGISLHAGALFKLLLLTGCRLGEIQKAEWPHVDFGNGWLEVPASKTGWKRVALPAPAVEILADLHKVRSQSRWVIEGDRPGSFLVNPAKAWKRCLQRAGIDNLRIHDTRHAWASFAAMEGLGLPIIGAQLGHRRAETTSRYSHIAASPIKAAAERVGAIIMEHVANGGAQVVDLPRKDSAP